MMLRDHFRSQDIRIDGLRKVSAVASIMVCGYNVVDWCKLDRSVVYVQERNVAGMGIAVADAYVHKERRDKCGQILVWLP